MGGKYNRRERASERRALRKTLKRGTRYRVPTVNIGVLVTVLFLTAVIIVCGVLIMFRDKEKALPAPETTVTVTDTDRVQHGTILTFAEDDVHRGELILVNSDYEFVFPEVREDVSVYDNKTISYKVNDRNVTMSMTAITPFNKLMDDFYAETQCRDVMVVSGFRTEEFQRQLYNDRVATDGVEIAAQYVALPGQSEHHTGLAMDLSVYTDAGEGYYVRNYEKCAWLVENFENYGFILRYPEEKANITGISYESWHYRYVGLPHSLIMKEQDLCFEEYIELIRLLEDGTALSWDGTASAKMKFDGDGNDDVYLIYHITAEKAGDTEILIPENRTYTVSGDNVDGFIVTLYPVEK